MAQKRFRNQFQGSSFPMVGAGWAEEAVRAVAVPGFHSTVPLLTTKLEVFIMRAAGNNVFRTFSW